MNGLPLLLLATTVGMDFGWEPTQENPQKLEYIVQLSPEELQLISKGTEELWSGIPKELNGRIDRIVIRMGRAELPRVPSLEQLRTMAATTSNPSILNAAGSSAGSSSLAGAAPAFGASTPLVTQGGLATIDPPRAGSGNVGTGGVMPAVNNGGPSYDVLGSGAYEDLLRQSTMPPVLQNNASGLTNAIADRVADNAGNTASFAAQQNQLNGASAATGDPRLTNSAPGALLPPPPSTLPSNSSILPRDPAPPSLVNAPANAGASQGGNLLPSTSSNTNLPNTGWVPANPNLANSATANNGRPTNGAGAPTGFNSGFIAGNTLGNNPQILPSNNAPAFSNASGGTFANNNNAVYPTNNNPPASTGFSPAGFNHGGFAHHSSTGGSPPLLANNTKPVSSSNDLTFEEGDLSPSEKNPEAKPNSAVEEATKSRWENVLQVLFILSLVVNFYLGVLMHKLALRYRTLLASVRATTVPA